MRKTGHIGNACAGIQYTQKSCHAFIGMMKRKNRESSVLRRDFNLFKNSDDVRTDIILTEHNAFGDTGRTGGINKNTERIRVDDVFFIRHIPANAKGRAFGKIGIHIGHRKLFERQIDGSDGRSKLRRKEDSTCLGKC